MGRADLRAGRRGESDPDRRDLLLLTSNRAAVMGSCFAVGWIVGVAVLAALASTLVHTLVISSDNPWITAYDIAIGGAFLTAATIIGTRARCGSRASSIDRLLAASPSAALGLGIVASAANPKVIALALAAALELVGRAAWTEAAGAALFTMIGATAVLVPLGAYFFLPPSSHASLGSARTWVVQRESRVLTLLGVAIGAILLVDGLRRLTS